MKLSSQFKQNENSFYFTFQSLRWKLVSSVYVSAFSLTTSKPELYLNRAIKVSGNKTITNSSLSEAHSMIIK